MLYPDDPTHDKAMAFMRENYSFACILHDKDVWSSDDEEANPLHIAGQQKKAHYHWVIKFRQARWNTAVLKELGIAENYLLPCNDFDKALAYLVHEGWEEKFQYPIDAVEGDLKGAVEKQLNATDENSRVFDILDLLEKKEYVNYLSFFKELCNLGYYSDARRMGSLLVKCVDEHNQEYIEGFQKARALETEMLKRMERLSKMEEFFRWLSDKEDDILPLEN